MMIAPHKGHSAAAEESTAVRAFARMISCAIKGLFPKLYAKGARILAAPFSFADCISRHGAHNPATKALTALDHRRPDTD
jgi:hypothetical protein